MVNLDIQHLNGAKLIITCTGYSNEVVTDFFSIAMQEVKRFTTGSNSINSHNLSMLFLEKADQRRGPLGTNIVSHANHVPTLYQYPE